MRSCWCIRSICGPFKGSQLCQDRPYSADDMTRFNKSCTHFRVLPETSASLLPVRVRHLESQSTRDVAHRHSAATNAIVTKAVLITVLQKSRHPESKCTLLVADQTCVSPLSTSLPSPPSHYMGQLLSYFLSTTQFTAHALTYDVATVHNNSSISSKQTQTGNQERKCLGS